MNRTLLQAQSMYADMGRAERRVADWLLSHPGEVMPYAIRELADACEASEATIVRFSRRLGFQGYQDLKLSLASEAEKKVITPHITAADACFEVFEKICNDAYLSLERTKKTLSSTAMADAADAIAYGERIVLIGLGSSASVAQDASDKLLRAGCNSASYGDTHMQTVAVSQLREGDVLIGVSHSGASKDVVDAMRLGAERGARTIAITSRERSPITRVSDITLLTDTEEVRHSTLGLSSHLSRLLVLDALCYRVVYMNEDKIRDMLRATESSLSAKRVV